VNGFDSAHPIALNAGELVHPTASGKRTAAELYAGDGCHHLALLMCAGRERLEPGEYVVRRFVEYTPRDNIGLLLAALGGQAGDHCVLSFSQGTRILSVVDWSRLADGDRAPDSRDRRR